MVAMFLALAALASSTPSVEFTSDSVYKKDNILEFSVSERILEDETASYTLNVKENFTLGYCVFNDPNTAYVDGVKVDGAFLPSDWKLDGFDPNAKHVVTVKTVYSNDVAGWFAMAKAGDFSALISNPITVLQLVYYAIAAVSIVLGGFGLVKSKRAKAKTAAEIADAVAKKSEEFEDLAFRKMKEAEDKAIDMLDATVTPILDSIGKKYDAIIQATVLARSGDEKSTLALLELLKDCGGSDIAKTIESVRAQIKETYAKATEAKTVAIEKMKEAVAEISAPAEPEEPRYDGTSI